MDAPLKGPLLWGRQSVGFVHHDVMKWKHFPHYWPFVRGIHRSPVNSPPMGQWREALMLTLICASTNGWANNREASDLRCHSARYDVLVMGFGGFVFSSHNGVCDTVTTTTTILLSFIYCGRSWSSQWIYYVTYVYCQHFWEDLLWHNGARLESHCKIWKVVTTSPQRQWRPETLLNSLTPKKFEWSFR